MTLQIFFAMDVKLALVAEKPVRFLDLIQMFKIGMFDERPSLVAIVITEVARVLGIFLVNGFAHSPTQVMAHGSQVRKQQRAIRTLYPVLLDLLGMLQVCMFVVLSVVQEGLSTESALSLPVRWASVLRPFDAIANLVTFRMKTNFLVRDEATLTLECSLTVGASDPVDVQLLAVLMR